MNKVKNKYYVVWKGSKPGIYSSWAECQKQINGYPNARYKGFKTHEMALKAFSEGSENYWGKDTFESTLSNDTRKIIGSPIKNSISVDGAWNTSTGKAEYQGVLTEDRTLLFHQGPFEDGTNNIVEFLAIVHALSYCKKHKLTIPIYSDSKIAINWVKRKEMATNKEKNKNNHHLFDLLDRAVKWLKENEYSNKILKWETKAWGENPADFGRK